MPGESYDPVGNTRTRALFSGTSETWFCNSVRRTWISLGASIPMRTLLRPISSTVTTTLSPIRMRSVRLSAQYEHVFLLVLGISPVFLHVALQPIRKCSFVFSLHLGNRVYWLHATNTGSSGTGGSFECRNTRLRISKAISLWLSWAS